MLPLKHNAKSFILALAYPKRKKIKVIVNKTIKHQQGADKNHADFF